MKRVAYLFLVFSLAVGLFPALSKPAVAASMPSFNSAAIFSVQNETSGSYYLSDAKGLPDGKTAVLMSLYSGSGYQFQLRIFDRDGSIISTTNLNSLMDTRYKLMEVQMLALKDGNILISYNRSDTSNTNTFLGTVAESGNGAYFIIVNQSGQKVVNQTKINTYNGSNSLTRSISMAQLSGGNIAFSYQRNDNVSIATRVFTSAGAAASSETLLVNANAITSVAAAGNDDTYMVVYNAGYPSNTVQMSHFSSSGALIGSVQDLGAVSNASIIFKSLSNGNYLYGVSAYSGNSTPAKLFDSSGTQQGTFTINSGLYNGNFAVYNNAGQEGFVIGTNDAASTNAINDAYNNGTDWTGSVYYYFNYYLNDGTFVARTAQPVDSGAAALQGWNEDWWDFNVYYVPSFFLVSGYAEGVGQIKTYNPTPSTYAIDATLYDMSGGSSPATQESTPTASIDYINEQLVGLTPSGAYKINGTTVTADASGKLAIDSSWIGTTLSVVKAGNGTTISDSSAQSLAIASRPAAPTSVGKTDETYPNAGNGTLTGVTNAMEYKASASSTWTGISGTTVTGLAPGSYEVRVKATSSAFASTPTTVTVSTIPATPESTPTATVDYINEQLVGLTPSGAYKINGTTVTADASGKLAIDSSWIGTTLSVVKAGNGTTISDSSAQSLAIASRPAAPTSVGKTDETYPNAGNGTLTGVTNAMEYKASASSTWTGISGTTVTGLAPGSYEVRVKATSSAFASTPTTVTVSTIPATPESTPTATVDYINEQLVGLTPSGAYKINGTTVTADASGKLAIDSSWIGTTLSVVKKGNGTTKLDSLVQSLVIPTRPAAPEVAADDGRNTIISLDSTMEFSVDGASFVKFDGTNDPSLNGNHIVKVRIAATESQLVGNEITINFTQNPFVSHPEDDSVEVWVNGKVQNAGKAYTTEVNGVKQTTVVVDADKLKQRLEEEGKNAVVTIPVKSSSGIIVGQLDGQMIKNMQDLNATLVLQTDKGSYTLPSNQINLDSIAKQLGGQLSLSDLVVKVTIEETPQSIHELANNAGVKGRFTIVAPPIDFEVTVTHDGKTLNVTRFNIYVERTVALPEGIDPTNITTGVVIEEDGTVRHVPTQIKVIDGKYYAAINSLTNSTYTVVWHPISFADVEKHWAKEAVNEMGSRLIVNGTSETIFNPDADITRAEFAAIIVRGLGLKLGQGSHSFDDVNSGAWYSSTIQTAASYGLINGFEDGTFRPNDKITREEAMLIIARAMKLTGLADKTGAVDATLLNSFSDSAGIAAWAKKDVALVVEAELIKGRKGKLEGKSYVTRAEVATIIQRLLQQSGLI